MHTKQISRHPGMSGRPQAILVAALGLPFCIGVTGCLSSLAKHSAAVEIATAPVIDEASEAYRGAQKLHDLKVDYETIETFHTTQKIDPSAIVSFPDDQAIQVRLTVLEAFKCYVLSLVEITNGVDSPGLDAAARSVGASMTSFGNTLAPTVEDALHLTQPASGTTTITTITSGGTTTTTSATAAAPLISATAQKITSAAVLALGEFLISRKIKKELPGRIEKMDPVLKQLCDVLSQDIEILEKQEVRDTEYIRDHQILFLQTAKLDPQQQRMQTGVLPELIRLQRRTDQQLLELRGSIDKLYLTHHALAADAGKNNPRALRDSLSDLASAGDNLGKFYSTLGTKK